MANSEVIFFVFLSLNTNQWTPILALMPNRQIIRNSLLFTYSLFLDARKKKSSFTDWFFWTVIRLLPTASEQKKTVCEQQNFSNRNICRQALNGAYNYKVLTQSWLWSGTGRLLIVFLSIFSFCSSIITAPTLNCSKSHIQSSVAHIGDNKWINLHFIYTPNAEPFLVSLCMPISISFGTSNGIPMQANDKYLV